MKDYILLTGASQLVDGQRRLGLVISLTLGLSCDVITAIVLTDESVSMIAYRY